MAYTSDKEFELEGRVQLTNEIPPMDMYDGVHSTLKNSMWKWLLGFSDVSLDLDYKGNFDKTDVDEPLKIVNDKIAKEYGPKQQDEWNPETNEYIIKNPSRQTRIEINGMLLPEEDLFLHEIYRYLSLIYPNHPDWVELLTHNEIVDSFENAAALVDYKPNDKFFLLVAENLTKLEKDTDLAREELKLLLRNLTNISYRRKFYGSTYGLKMIAAQIYELASIFPAGQYLPLKPEKVDYSITEVDKDILPKILPKSADKERVIDTFDPNFKKRFRIIDWEGKSKDVKKSTIEEYKITGINIVGNEKNIFELFENTTYQIDNLSITSQIDKNFTFEKDTSVGYILAFVETPIINSKFENNQIKNEVLNKKAYNIDTSTNFKPTYIEGYNYGLVTDFQQMIIASYENGSIDLSKSLFSSAHYLNGENNEFFIKEYKTNGFLTYLDLIKYVYKNQTFQKFNFVLNPYRKDTIFLEPSETLKAYNEHPRFVFDKEKGLTYQEDEKYQWSDNFIKRQSIISLNNLIEPFNKFSLHQIVGFNHGYIELTGIKLEEKDFKKYDYQSIGIFKTNDNTIISPNQYCLVFKTKHKKYVVLEGALQIIWEKVNVYHRAAKLKFYIKSIPTIKEDSICKLIYSEFEKSLKKIEELTEELKNYDIDSETYKNLTKEIEKLNLFITECKKNRDFIIDSEGLITFGYMSELYNGYLISYVGNKYYYNVQDYLPEQYFVTHFDFGSVSLLPLVSKEKFESSLDSYEFKLLEYNDRTTSSAKYVLPVLKQEFFNHDCKNLQVYPSLLAKPFYEYVFSTYKDNFSFKEKEKYFIEIEATSEITDGKHNTLTFKESKYFDCLTTGDFVYGNGLPSGTYIKSKNKNSVILNNMIPRHGTYRYKFSILCNSVPVEKTNITYKNELFKVSSISDSNPFNNGLYGSDKWPNVHEAYIDGLNNPKNIKVWDFKNSFDDVVNYLYSDKIKNKTNFALIPSTINLSNEFFYEMNLKHLNYIENRRGEKENLVNVEWIDYLETESDKASQAKDNIFTGVNLMLQTDMSGYYTLVKNRKYTDPKLKILFQTFGWNENTIPAYAQIGSGGITRKKWFKSVSDIIYPDVYGADFFDTQRPFIEQEILQMETEGGIQRKRNVYNSSKIFDEVKKELKNEGTVEAPIFEVPLGEYDIQKNYDPGDGRLTTTVSFTFQKQNFSNLFRELVDNEKLLSIQNKNFSNKFYKKDDLYKYIGDFNQQLNYPDITDNDNKYWTILSGIKLKDTVIKNSSLLMYENGFHIRSPLFGGVLTSKDYYTKDLENNTYSLFINRAAMFVEEIGKYNDVLGREFTLEDSLLIRYHYIVNNEVKPSLKNYDNDYFTIIKNKIINQWKGEDNKIDGKKYIIIGYIDNNDKLILYSFIVKNKDVIVVEIEPSQFSSTISLENGSSEDLNLFYGIVPQLYCKNNNNFETITLDTPTQNYQNLITKIKLPRRCITDGSYNFEITVDPYFLSKGYLIENNNGIEKINKSKEVEFNVSENNIYYDDVLKCFYTTARIFNNGKLCNECLHKIALKFEEQKFFKDVKYLEGTYKVHNIQGSLSTNIIKEVEFTPIAGVTFDISDLSSSDRILQVEEVYLRSFYNKDKEPVLFSNYSTIVGEIHGIDIDGNIVVGGYREGDETYTSNKSAFATEVQKFLEVKYGVDDNGEATVSLVDDKLSKVFDKDRSPILKNPVIKKSFFEDSISNINNNDRGINFKYFKNYLVLEGKFNFSSKKFIESDRTDFFQAALDKISVGDEIKAITPLQVSGKTHRHSIKCNLNANGFDLSSYSEIPLIVKFEGNRVIAGCESDLVYVSDEIGDISSISEIDLKAYTWKNNRPIYFDDVDKPKMIQLDYYGGHWYSTYRLGKENSNANIIVQFDSTDFSDRKEIFNEINKEDWGNGTKQLEPDAIVALEDDAIFKESLGTEYVKYKDVSFKTVKTEEVKRKLYYKLSDKDKKDKDYFNTPTLNKYHRLPLYNNSKIEDKGEYPDKEDVGYIEETFLQSTMTEGAYVVDDPTKPDSYTQKIYATNGDIEVFANKNILFINSKTKKYDWKEKNGVKMYIDNGKLTDKNHWKKGIIPLFESTLLTNLKGMNDIEAYSWCRTVLSNFLDEYKPDNNLSIEQLINWEETDEALKENGNPENYKKWKNLVYESIKNIKLATFDEFKKNVNVNIGKKTFKVNSYPIPLKENNNGNFVIKQGLDFDIPCKDAITIAETYDQKELYRIYLYYILVHITGTSDKRNIYTDTIKQISFTKNDIIFLLKDSNILKFPLGKTSTAEDISNPENWTVVESPIATTYMKKHEGIMGTIYVEIENRLLSINEPTFGEEVKAYTIDHIYTVGDYLFLGGYFESANFVKDQIKKYAGDYWSESSEYYNTMKSLYEKTLSTNTTLPAIFYIKDGESSLGSFNLKKELSQAQVEGSNSKLTERNCRISALNYLNGEILYSIGVYDSNGINTNSYKWPFVLNFDSFNNLIVDESQTNDDNKKPQLKEVKDFIKTLPRSKQYSALNGEIISWAENERGIDYEKNPENTKGYLFDYITYSNIKVPAFCRVASKTDLGFSLNTPITIEDDIGIATVLIAIKTEKQISDQTLYLNPLHLPQYVNSLAQLKVPTFEEVIDKSTADKMYSMRQNIRQENQAQGITYGYPTLEEDEKYHNHKFYEYDVTEINGELLYIYKGLTNSQGSPIYYCTEDGLQTFTSEGYYQELRRPVTQVSLYNCLKNPGERDWLQAGIPILTEIKSIANTIDYFIEDTDLTNFIRKNISLFHEYNYQETGSASEEPRKSVPYVKIDSNYKIENFTKYLLEIDNEIYKQYVEAENNSNIKEWSSQLSNEDVIKLSVIQNAVGYYESAEGRWGNLSNNYEYWFFRLTSKKIGNKYYLFDEKEQLFILKYRRYLYSNVKIPYSYQEGSQILYNQQLNIVKEGDKYVLKLGNNLPINFIHLPLKGYGYLRNSTQESTEPWNIDKDAFYDGNLFNSENEPIYLVDKYGNKIGSNQVKALKYSSFKELIDKRGFIVKSDSNPIQRENDEILSISAINKDGSGVKFTKPIMSDNNDLIEKLNDGNEHYLRLKILCIADTPAPVNEMNNPDYYCQIDKSEIHLFTPNRVYFNENGLPHSPIKIDNEIYGTENSYAFYSDDYLNLNGSKIFECNSDGKYITWTKTPKNIGSKSMGTKNKIFSEELPKSGVGYVTLTTDSRFNPRKPIYNTCEEWFKNEFYVKGQEKNPFWQIIKIYPEFNKYSKKFQSKCKVFEWKKLSSEMRLVEVDKNNRFVFCENPVLMNDYAGNVTFDYNAEFIDLMNGELRLIERQPEDKYKEQQNFVSYGIYYKNSFNKTNGILSNIWKDNIRYESYILCNYTVNSTEDFANLHNKDISIVDISEMAILDKDRYIIAYALFPTIEYRSATQHCSFTCFINKDNLIEEKTN